MQINLNKFSQFILTMLGLVLLALAAMLNHLHPHNQGIADINQRSIYRRLGIASASSDSFVNLSYARALPAAAVKVKDKIPDPTTATSDSNAALPPATMAGPQPNDQNADTSNQAQDQSQSAPAKSANPQDPTKS